MASARGVRIWQQIQDHWIAGGVDGFRFTMMITDGQLIPNEIFRYEPLPPGFQCTPSSIVIGPQGPQADTQCAIFNGVCSPVDLVEYPVGAPALGSNPPYFRLNYIDLLFRSRKEAEDAIQDIKTDIARLIHSMNANDSLGPIARFWVGDILPAGVNDSQIVP
jgi:hypothetical protein